MSFDQDTVRRLVREQFPELRCVDVTLLGEGMDSSAWLIGGRCVFRFPKREVGAACLQNEIRVLLQIADRLLVRVSAAQWIGQPTEDEPLDAHAVDLRPAGCSTGLGDYHRVALRRVECCGSLPVWPASMPGRPGSVTRRFRSIERSTAFPESCRISVSA